MKLLLFSLVGSTSLILETNVDLKWQEFMGRWTSMMKRFKSTKIWDIRPWRVD